METQYHGSKVISARLLIKNGIDVSLGGGEFGKGFYTGLTFYKAKAWAKIKYNTEWSVIQLDINLDDFIALDPLLLTCEESVKFKEKIKSLSAQRHFEFKRNAIWGKIVGGSELGDSDQVKYKSTESQDYLNSNKVIRTLKYHKPSIT